MLLVLLERRIPGHHPRAEAGSADPQVVAPFGPTQVEAEDAFLVSRKGKTAPRAPSLRDQDLGAVDRVSSFVDDVELQRCFGVRASATSECRLGRSRFDRLAAVDRADARPVVRDHRLGGAADGVVNMVDVIFLRPDGRCRG